MNSPWLRGRPLIVQNWIPFILECGCNCLIASFEVKNVYVRKRLRTDKKKPKKRTQEKRFLGKLTLAIISSEIITNSTRFSGIAKTGYYIENWIFWHYGQMDKQIHASKKKKSWKEEIIIQLMYSLPWFWNVLIKNKLINDQHFVFTV